MKLFLIAFTEQGIKLAARLAEEMPRYDIECKVFTTAKEQVSDKVSILEESLSLWTQRAFQSADAIVFVGACGIAVRSIASYLQDKWKDPAVVVVDERGKFAVSLVSGHVGGANHLTQQIASILGAQPVITTATDVNHLFAVDVWAKENNFLLKNRQVAKKVSAALLNGKTVAVQSDFPITGVLPEGMTKNNSGALGICISFYGKNPYEKTCLLNPRSLVLGVGCRKGTTVAQIEDAVCDVLESAHLSANLICLVCSIDLKAEEPGLLEFCRGRQLPLSCFSAEKLSVVPGGFTASPFVSKVTGVDNVCERAAVLGADYGELILKKQIKQSVTVAVAAKHVVLNFGG